MREGERRHKVSGEEVPGDPTDVKASYGPPRAAPVHVFGNSQATDQLLETQTTKPHPRRNKQLK